MLLREVSENPAETLRNAAVSAIQRPISRIGTRPVALPFSQMN